MHSEAPRPSADVPVAALFDARASGLGPCLYRVEARFDELDEHEVCRDHAQQDQEEAIGSEVKPRTSPAA